VNLIYYGYILGMPRKPKYVYLKIITYHVNVWSRTVDMNQGTQNISRLLAVDMRFLKGI
jgi:hypothetical protein